MTRGRLRWLVAAAVVAVGVTVGAMPAGAHASLVSSEPAAQARLDASPSEIVLHFDEPVEATLGGLRVFDAEERRHPVGPLVGVPGDDTSLRADVDEALGDGLYIVMWRATSADGHPVNGAFTFQVGTGAVPDTSGLLERLLAGGGVDDGVGRLLDAARFVGYVGLVLLVGGMVFLAGIWPGGAERGVVRWLLWGGWAAALVGAVGTFVLQGPYVTGTGLGDVADVGLWADVADTRTGRALLLRLLAVAAATCLLATLRRVRQAGWQALAATVAGALVVSVAYAGHAGTGRLHLIGLLLGVVHVGAMSVWLGGIVLLGLVVLPRRSRDQELAAPTRTAQPVGAAVASHAGSPSVHEAGELDDVVQRFSRVAGLTIALVVITGVAQAFRLVEGWDALWDTDYGRLLLLKTSFVLVLLLLAAFARLIVRRRWPAPGELRPVVLAELTLGVAVLLVTAVLVGTSPTDSAASSRPFSTTLVQSDTLASITIEPARQGASNAIHVYISPPGGALARVENVTGRLTLPSRNLGPLPVPFEPAGPNHFSAYGVALPFEGTWQLEVLAETPPGTTVRFSTPFTVD